MGSRIVEHLQNILNIRSCSPGCLITHQRDILPDNEISHNEIPQRPCGRVFEALVITYSADLPATVRQRDERRLDEISLSFPGLFEALLELGMATSLQHTCPLIGGT
jgi:hypothetical protein